MSWCTPCWITAAPTRTTRLTTTVPQRGRNRLGPNDRCHRQGARKAAAGAEVLLRRRAVRRGADRPAHPARPGRPPRRDPRLRTRSRPRSPGRWPPTGTGSAGPCTRPPASSWTAAPKTYRPSDQAARCFVADRDRACGFPAATAPPPSATATTSSPSPTTARPPGSTSDRCAANTTTPRPTASGNSPYHPDTGTKTWTSPLGKTYTKSADPPLARPFLLAGHGARSL